MDATRWQQIRTVFDAVVELPAATWPAELMRLCGPDEQLRDEVLALLEADVAAAQQTTRLASESPDLLREAAEWTEAQAADSWVGCKLGPWRLLQVIGTGGMGRVYLAERHDDYRQRSAVKIVREGVDRGEVIRRFRAERQILANLQHPNIAALFDGGLNGDGVPWFALEYVDGSPITQWCDDRRISIRQRLLLFLDVCAAVAHAHGKLVVHRDLKPGNILVDEDGRIKLLDFGIAKLIDTETAGDATQANQALFTPEYAAPEQMQGDPPTTAVDIYALGRILFELLTGCSPYTRPGTGSSALLRMILEHEPARPSAATARQDLASECGSADQRASARSSTTTRLRRQLRGDLDAIVLKALRREPTQRYATVRELAEDLRAFLETRPVLARRGHFRYRASRFLRRHALATGFAFVAFLALAGGFGMALWQEREARMQRDLAQTEAVKTRRVIDFLNNVFRVADPRASAAGNVTARELLDQAGQRIRNELTDEPDIRNELLTVIGRAQLGVGLYDDALALLQSATELSSDPSIELTEAEALHNLGRYREAEQKLDEAERLLRNRSAIPSMQAALAYRRGLTLQALGEIDSAADAYRKAIEIRLALMGADANETLEAQVRYSILLTLDNQYAQAKELAQEALDRLRRQKNVPPLQLGDAYWALAIAQDNLGEDDEAESLMNDRLALFKATLGERHPRTAGALNDLGNIAYQRRDYAQAVSLILQARDLFAEIIGPDHPSIATYENNLGNAIMAQGKIEQARPHLLRAYDLRIKHYGPAHHTISASLHSLGVADIRLGRFDDAERELVDAVQIHERQFGPTHAGSLLMRADLALARFLLGRVEGGCEAASAAAGTVKTDTHRGMAGYAHAMQAHCQYLNGDGTAKARTRDALQAVREHYGDEAFRTVQTARLIKRSALTERQLRRDGTKGATLLADPAVPDQPRSLP